MGNKALKSQDVKFEIGILLKVIQQIPDGADNSDTLFLPLKGEPYIEAALRRIDQT